MTIAYLGCIRNRRIQYYHIEYQGTWVIESIIWAMTVIIIYQRPVNHFVHLPQTYKENDELRKILIDKNKF